MRIEGFDAVLRPRSMAEAADLGVALVQHHRASVWRCHAPVVGAIFLVALAATEVNSWLATTLIFWLKPLMDRALLFVLSRAVFGEETRWADVWRERRHVFGERLWSTLTLRRLSPWRSYTQPVAQLEGQHGKALRQRRAQILRNKRPAAAGMHMMFAQAETALLFGVASLALWFAPEGTRGDLFDLVTSEALGIRYAGTTLYALAVLVVEPFYVASGFAMYLNRRVELEAWDVEQEFRRAFAR